MFEQFIEFLVHWCYDLIIDTNVILMDEEIFQSTPLQRVYQYLRSKDSTNIRYVPGSIVERNVPEVLSLLLK